MRYPFVVKDYVAMSRAFRFSLILLMLFAVAASLFACTKTTEEPIDPSSPEQPAVVTTEKEPKTVLFLGDSIGEAIAGMSPLTEREAYGYYGILGNCNGLFYYNRSVTAYTSANLQHYLKQENDGITMMKSLVAGADLIHISILGNDFLNSNHNTMMINLANDNYDDIGERQEKATQKLDETLAYIRSLNPDATILIQTLYNPAGPDSPLVPSYARSVLASKGIGSEGYHALMGKLIKKINDVLTDYLASHTVTDESGKEIRPFELADVGAAFEAIYQSDPLRWPDLFCDDGVHPSNEGHAIIAGVLQAKFAELGFASLSALQNYKRDKVSQLRRLFSGSADLDAVRTRIMAASEFDGVTKAYFDGVRGLIPAYVTLPEPSGETFSKALSFNLCLASIFDYNLLPLLDPEESGVVFRANGEYTLTLTAKPLLNSLLSIAISSQGKVDVGDYAPVSLVLPYIHDIAPDIEPTDLEALFDVLERLYGIKVEGIDFEKESVQRVLEGFRERTEIVFDDPDMFEDTIRVTFTGKYRLADMTDPVTGEKIKAIYVNNGVGKGESYIRYTYTENEDEKKVRMRVDVIEAVLEGVIYAE